MVMRTDSSTDIATLFYALHANRQTAAAIWNIKFSLPGGTMESKTVSPKAEGNRVLN
jgi:hypothetical protein